MSDDSDVSTSRTRSRKCNTLADNSDSSIETSSKRRRRKFKTRRRESDEDSDSSVEILRKKKRVGRVTSDSDGISSGSDIGRSGQRNVRALVTDSDTSSSSGSEIGRTKKRGTVLVTDSESDSEYDSDWVTEAEPEPPSRGELKPDKVVEDNGASSDCSDGQTDKCPICLLPFKNQEVGSPESCDHCFCVDCIIEWSKNVNTCPVDRQSFNLILVRKNYNGKVIKQIPIEPPQQQQNEVDEIVEDPTFCEVCERCDREDRMLLCDGCDLGYHLECLDPPLDSIPPGVWFCTDCRADVQSDSPPIDIYEVHLLLEDAETLGWPVGSRRRNATAPRLVPRTRQSERVRARIITHRNQRQQHNVENQNLDGPGPSTSSRNRSSSSANQNKKRKYKKRKRRKSNIKITYEIDEATGEKIAIKTKIRKRRRKTKSQRDRARCVDARPKTVKKRLAVQLGICPSRTVSQTLPDVRVQHNSNNLGFQRSQAGIPTLHLFGQRHELDYFSGTDSEHDGGGAAGGVNVLIRRRPQLSDASILRRAARRKSVMIPQATSTVTSTSNILDSILDSQSKFHSKNAVLSLGKDGTVKIDPNRIDLNKSGNVRLRQTPLYGNGGANENGSVYSGATDYMRRSSSSENQNTVSTSSVEAVTSQRSNDEADSEQNYLSSQPVCSSFDSDKKDKDKDKSRSRSNTPATHSDSEFDIYSDIETVSTSRAEESYLGAEESYLIPPPTPPRLGTPNTATDEDGNNSDADLVIDTDKVESEQVSSTVDSTGPIVLEEPISSQAPHSTSDMVQSSGLINKRRDDKDDQDDDDSEDGCPNFSIYSSESITLAKNSDLQLLNENSLSGLPVEENVTKPPSSELENVVGTSEKIELLPRPVLNSMVRNEDASCENEEAVKTASKAKIMRKTKILPKIQVASKPVGLYSDSEDENIVKIDHDKPFGIGDLRNMTEDISEEERSYTPCLDENAPSYKQGLEGLDTELISDEDRNDFDESHELKTVSDGGDALEINAKESELDFTKPEDYEEGEIVDKSKANKIADEESNQVNETDKENEPEPPKKDDRNKENEVDNAVKEVPSSFKKLSKNTKERNYRDKDKPDKERDRSKSKERKDKEKRRKEKRKEIERYNVRSMIAEKPRRITKDKFGRELRRRSGSRSSPSQTPPPRRSASREPPVPADQNKKRRQRRSLTRSRSPPPERKRSRSHNKKRRSSSRDKNKSARRKSRDRSKNKTPKDNNRNRQKSRSPSPRRRRDFGGNRRGWSRSASRTVSPEQRLTPSWTPPRLMESRPPRNLTVILNNDLNKKKREKKKKEKRARELEKSKRRRKDQTPPPSKEVFASGNNILVSVSFNKDNNERDVTKRKRDSVDEISTKRTRKEREKRKKDDRRKKRNQAISGMKPVAIIDLERSPFREITPAAEDIIVLTDSENGESNDMTMQATACDSSQQVVSPERSVTANYLTGPKTPPEPQVKFSLNAKQPQMRAISNPLHEPDDVEVEIDPQEELEQRLNETLHKGPNTPPDPPNSPPSSPDVYDPFDPTKSRSPTPEPALPQTVQSTSQNDNARDESLMDSRNDDDVTVITDSKSHTPPVVADVQPADSQSNIKTTTTPEKSPERPIGVIINQVVQSQAAIFAAAAATSKPIPATYSTASMITSTPLSNLTTARINILNSTILTPSTIASAVPQRIVLPNTIKSSPVKVSPTKFPIKSTPIKPMPVKNKTATVKHRKRNQNGVDNADVALDFDSPYSPGSSDYEDLFEPPPDTGIKKLPPQKNTNKPTGKVQSAFDTLFGSSPANTNFKRTNRNDNNKFRHKKNPKGSKLVGVKIDEDTLKILDELPNSAVEMQVKDKYLKKLNRQERVVEEVKLVLKPHYNKKHINKEEYKDILRRSVPKICHNKSGEINPKKIQNLIEAYVKKIRHSKKVTSSSSSMNPQKA